MRPIALHHLQSLGVGPESLVAKHGTHPRMLAVLLAFGKRAGPMCRSIQFPAERLAYMLESSQAKVLVAAKRARRAARLRRQVVMIDDDWDAINVG
jgi:non-ribosomal peptide synthetase component F